VPRPTSRVGVALGVVLLREPAVLRGPLQLARLVEEVSQVAVGLSGPVVRLGGLSERLDGSVNGLGGGPGRPFGYRVVGRPPVTEVGQAC
jgi:hypothetical protein